MADLYVASAADIATGTGTKTLLEIATPATTRARLKSLWIDFEGTDATAAPIRVELLRATAVITGTSITPRPQDEDAPASLLTAKHTASGEGTPGNVLEYHNIPPTLGEPFWFPLSDEYVMAVSSFLRIRTVSPGADVQAAVGMRWLE